MARYILFSAIAFMLSVAAEARPVEPEKIEPAVDTAFVATLGLATQEQDWNDPIINILVVGQDARGGYQSGSKYRRNGQMVPGLGSRADGNLLLSFNKTTGQVSILALYRGMMVPDSFWSGVADTPGPVTDAVTGAVTPSGELYLANYYVIAGRAKYVGFVRSTFETFMTQHQLQNQYFSNGHLKIHGLVETGFAGFKGAINDFFTYFGSSVKVGWAMKGHAAAFAEIFAKKSEIISELTIQASDDGIAKSGISDATLKAMRERHAYSAGGYQRSFNHAKFFTSVFGFFGYTMAEAQFPDILKEQVIDTIFQKFSRTFDLALFDSHLRTDDRGLHMLARTGFQKGASPVYVVQMGATTGSYAVYQNGAFKASPGILKQINPKVEIIPKANDCPACLPK